MSILTGLVGNAAGLYSALTGAPQLVQFLDTKGNTIVQFDASINETYTTTTTPTVFPVEDGSSITDHIVRTPIELQISCIVSDSPLGNAQQLQIEAATVAATAVLPPLGVVTATAGLSIWQAHQSSASPSIAAYNTLVLLQNGNPTVSPPVPPSLFSVKTKVGTYNNMVIKSLSVPRDSSTGEALVFNMSLQQITIVLPQTLSVNGADVPGLAAAKQSLGDKQGEELDGFTAGDQLGESLTNKASDTISQFGSNVKSFFGGGS